MQAPTSVRWLTQTEWGIVTGVFGDTLPIRQRIFVTNALGAGNAPFTIPTAALNIATLPPLAAAGFHALVAAEAPGPVERMLDAIYNAGLPGVAHNAHARFTGGNINLGYLVNIGPSAYASMTASQSTKDLLVHELTHVWQGANSIFTMNYVINSAFHQCKGMASSKTGRNAAYTFTPGADFSSYNAEQQASIVEHWYSSGQSQNSNLWPYIRDSVRKGRA
ncbi:MAG: hypothetical protein ACR2RA_15300 [Geminicoccaceae bacterium]